MKIYAIPGIRRINPDQGLSNYGHRELRHPISDLYFIIFKSSGYHQMKYARLN
jgi:hypothetical protein